MTPPTLEEAEAVLIALEQSGYGLRVGIVTIGAPTYVPLMPTRI